MRGQVAIYCKIYSAIMLTEALILEKIKKKKFSKCLGGHPDSIGSDVCAVARLAGRRFAEHRFPPSAASHARLALRRRKSRSSARVHPRPNAGFE